LIRVVSTRKRFNVEVEHELDSFLASLAPPAPVNDVEVEMALRHQKEERGDAYQSCEITDVIKISLPRNGVSISEEARFQLRWPVVSKLPQSDTRSIPFNESYNRFSTAFIVE
jgi:hypothetical protein